MSQHNNTLVLFTNGNERYFSSEDHVKNLKKIELSSMKDIIERHSICDIRVLLGHHILVTDDIHEISLAQPDRHVDDVFIGSPNNKGLNLTQFPFLSGLSYAEIIEQAIAASEWSDKVEFANEMTDLAEWENVIIDGVDSTKFYFSDNSEIAINVNHLDKIISMTGAVA